MRGARFGKALGNAVVVGHIDFAKDAFDIGGDLLAFIFLHVEDGDSDAPRRERARRGFAKTRCSARDDGTDRRSQFHGVFPRFPQEVLALPCAAALVNQLIASA